ncbi:hypothetical protein [Streptomyces sp. NPDC058092]|uniref:hypothetical protein n=1 Tax=Streptomyces sp. NPDC058092 TaxID=3346336 RepID=UPI0036EFCA2E
MSRGSWRAERTRYSPWGAVALVVLTGLALARNGADFSLGPPRPVAAASADVQGAAAGTGVAGIAARPHPVGPLPPGGGRAPTVAGTP